MTFRQILGACFLLASALSAGCHADDKSLRDVRTAADALLRDALVMKGIDPDIGDEHIAGAQARGLQDSRVAAARELLNDGDEKAIAFLSEHLANENVCLNHNNYQQAGVLVELSVKDAKAARAVIAGILGKDYIKEKYVGAAAALWRIDEEAARQALEEATEHQRCPVVQAFVETAGGKVAKETLGGMLKSKEDGIALLAATELAKSGDRSVIPVLAASLSRDRDDELSLWGDQRLAAKGLGQLYAKGGRDVLLKSLKDNRPFSGLGAHFCDLAKWEIMDRATAEDVELLQQFCKDDNETNRYWAKQALARVSPQAARPWIERGMEDKDPNVQVWAARQLAAEDNDAAIKFLEDCCYRSIGLGGAPGYSLAEAHTAKALLAYRRVVAVAAEKGADMRHNSARINVVAPLRSLELGLISLDDLLSQGSKEDVQALWNSLSGYTIALEKVQPILKAALAHKQYDAVIGAIKSAAITTEAEKRAATQLLTNCLASGFGLRAARLGLERRLLTGEAVRPAVLAGLKNPDDEQDALKLLADVGTRDDLETLKSGLITSEPLATSSAPALQRIKLVYRAIAAKRIANRDT